MSNAAASRLVMVKVSLVYRNGADIEKRFFWPGLYYFWAMFFMVVKSPNIIGR